MKKNKKGNYTTVEGQDAVPKDVTLSITDYYKTINEVPIVSDSNVTRGKHFVDENHK